jgi:hypothetical protein
MRAVLAAFLVFAVVGGAPGQEPTGDEPSLEQARLVPTPGELRGWYAPTTPDEAVVYLSALSDAFPTVTVDTLALAPGDPVVRDSVLPVHVVFVGRSGPSAVGAGDPSAAGERVRVLVLAGQRGDEPAGTEVALQIMRDLAAGDLPGLLDDLEFAFVPAANPWGLLWWIRDEPSGVDPSRDHVALRSRAARAVHDLAARWRPHIVIELREIGPSVYRVQVGLPVHPNVDPRLARYGRFYLLPYVSNELAKASITFREQVTTVPELAGRAPLVGGAEALPPGGFLSPGPLGADRARNAFALRGSLSIMLGVASVEGVEGLPSRAELQYGALTSLLAVTANKGDGLRERVATATLGPGVATVVGGDGDDRGETALSLRSRYERDENGTNLTWLVWSGLGTIQQQTTDRWRPAVRRLLALTPPAAWLIEPDAKEWADLARAHGFSVERLSRDARVEVGAYPLGVAGRLPAELTDGLPLETAPDASSLIVQGRRDFPEGTWVVRADQPGARLLFTLLEPWSQDAPLAREVEAAGTDPYPAAAGAGDSFVYPVFRIDADALARLRVEPPPDGGSTRGAAD